MKSTYIYMYINRKNNQINVCTYPSVFHDRCRSYDGHRTNHQVPSRWASLDFIGEEGWGGGGLQTETAWLQKNEAKKNVFFFFRGILVGGILSGNHCLCVVWGTKTVSRWQFIHARIFSIDDCWFCYICEMFQLKNIVLVKQ